MNATGVLTSVVGSDYGTSGVLERLPKTTKIIAFVGPSGAGKTSSLKVLRDGNPDLQYVTSVTTRARRDGDLPGEYEYISLEEFHRREQAGWFLWCTPQQHGARYGTMRSTIHELLSSQSVAGMHLIPSCVPRLLDAAGVEAVSLIFVTARRQDLERWLRNRDPGRPEEYYIERLETCIEWEAQARQSGLPYHFVINGNGDFQGTINQVIHHLIGG